MAVLFSKQIFYCRACGKEMHVTVNAPYSYQVCGKECWEEFEWRRTLSIMNEEYYPKPEGKNNERND